ncbi:T9SS type A sorting domain-containing protein [Algoriphagus sp. Y33]|uniref:T9SS type A sorting domain-containing protein n=1 Tax=Algoriphagus sp. Y33 TaxID=2772483 RepID=UPI0017867065|nr:T9SS type A sorting domain-containing protein [Algoriphagus sp. Y33]
MPPTPVVLANVPPNRFTVSLTPPANQGVISYNWYVGGILQSGEHNATIRIPWARPFCGNSYLVAVETVNACGTSAKRTVTLFDPPCFAGYSLRISPNPATSEAEIAVLGIPAESRDNGLQQEQLIEGETGELVLYDRLGNQLYQQQLKGGKTTINVSSLKPGTYMVKYYSQGGVLEGKLLKP